jgi:hypothetical protein
VDHTIAPSLSPEGEERRGFVKKAVYVSPAILTLQAAPAYAKYGSEKPGGGSDNWEDGPDKNRGKGNDKVSAALPESPPGSTPPVA